MIAVDLIEAVSHVGGNTTGHSSGAFVVGAVVLVVLWLLVLRWRRRSGRR